MTLDDLRRMAELLPDGGSVTLPRDALLGALTAVNVEPKAPEPMLASDELLTPQQVAERLGVSQRWTYDHAEQLGVRRLSRRCVRFSARVVERYAAGRARRPA